MCSISDGSTLSFGRVDEAARLLDAEQHDLRLGVGLGEHVAQRDRAALALGRHRSPVCLLHRRLHAPRTRGRRARRRTGRPRATRSISHCRPHGTRDSQMRDQRVLGLRAGHARRQPQADPRRGRRLDGGRGADHRRARRCRGRSPTAGPTAGRRRVPSPISSTPSSTVGVAAELLGRVRRRPSTSASRRGRRRSCCRARRAARRASGSAPTTGSGAGPPNMPECIALPSAAQRDVDARHAAQGRRERRHADREVAGVDDEDRVGAQQVGVRAARTPPARPCPAPRSPRRSA